MPHPRAFTVRGIQIHYDDGNIQEGEEKMSEETVFYLTPTWASSGDSQVIGTIIECQMENCSHNLRGYCGQLEIVMYMKHKASHFMDVLCGSSDLCYEGKMSGGS